MAYCQGCADAQREVAELDAKVAYLTAVLRQAERLFDVIAMHDQNGHALDGANKIRAALDGRE